MKKRIGVFEGGGANGIRQAVVCAAIEQEMGCSLVSRLDLVAGTSTGACLAALLVAGFSASSAVDFYEANLSGSNSIFDRGARQLWLGFGAHSTFYLHDNLREALERYVKIPINAASVPCLFLAREGLTDRANVFIKSYEPYWQGFPLALAALASSCAQVYFNGLEVDWQGARHRFQDGGMIENNPVLSVHTEAFRLGWQEFPITCVNPGCGRPYQAKLHPSPNGGLLTWKGGLELVQELMDAQSELSEQSGPALFSQYIRVNPFRRVPMGIDCSDRQTIKAVIADTRKWCAEERALIVEAAAALMP